MCICICHIAYTSFVSCPDVSLASLGHRYSPRLPEFLLQHAHYEPRLEPGGHRRAPGLERWGRSSSVPERSERFAFDLGEPGIHPPGQLTGSYASRDYPLVASDCAQRPSHGGSYLLRQRAPLSRLGRQFSISSDYVADSSLYEPSYNYPSFHGISDSLRATIGVNSDLHRPRHEYIHSDYRTLQTRPPSRDREAGLYPERRKKTVRFDSVSDEFNESGNESWENGWMTIQDLRAGRWGPGHGHTPVWPDQRQTVTGIPGISSHRAHGIIWDRQESQDSTARQGLIVTTIATIRHNYCAHPAKASNNFSSSFSLLNFFTASISPNLTQIWLKPVFFNHFRHPI